MKKIVALALSALVVVAASAQDVNEIMRKSTGLEVPVNSASSLKFEYLEKGKVVETRTLREFGYKDAKGIKRTLFYFDSPASVKGTRVLQVENLNKDDDKWAYEPSLRTTRQIAQSNRKASFYGSDFTYDDMSIRKFEQDTHKMLDPNASVTIQGKTYQCWKVESTPIEKGREFTYRIQFIDKESYLPMRIEFYDRKGMYKEWETLGYQYVKGADGKVTYTLRNGTELRNVRTGHSTRLTIVKFEFDNAKNVKESWFTTNWLNTGKF